MRSSAVVLMACLSACGGGDESAFPRVDERGEAFLVSVPPPIAPRGRTGREAPRVGRDESAARDEAREPRRSGGGGGDERDVACSYICGGFPACARPNGDGTCAFCESNARIRPSCRERFEAVEVCLRNFHCGLLENPGLPPLVVDCGLNLSVVEACVLGEDPEPKPLPPPPSGVDAGV